MDEADFASLIGFGERPSVEFKGPGSLADSSYLARVARAVLALSNFRGGGDVVLGIEDASNAVLGLTDAQLAEWRNREHVLDALSAYAFADPGLVIDLDFEPAARRCVVIRVGQFRTVPVICKKGYPPSKETLLRRGAIYCRRLSGRPSSVEANEPGLLRDVLDLAVDSQLNSFVDRSIKAGTLVFPPSAPTSPPDEERYAKQRGDF